VRGAGEVVQGTPSMAGMLTNDTLPVSGNPIQGVQTGAGYAHKNFWELYTMFSNPSTPIYNVI